MSRSRARLVAVCSFFGLRSYGAVVRNANAYVPPALRRAGAGPGAAPKANGSPAGQPAAAAAPPAAAGLHNDPAIVESSAPMPPSLQMQAPTPVLSSTPEGGDASKKVSRSLAHIRRTC